jgi:hypothetical protein
MTQPQQPSVEELKECREAFEREFDEVKHLIGANTYERMFAAFVAGRRTPPPPAELFDTGAAAEFTDMQHVNACNELIAQGYVLFGDMWMKPSPAEVSSEGLPVENDDADSAQHGPCDPKFFVRQNLERKKILRELHDKAVALGFDSAHQAINTVEAMERALSLQETHLDKHVAIIKQLKAEVQALSQQSPATEACELLRIWKTWLGPCRDSCDEEGQKLWDRIERALNLKGRS